MVYRGREERVIAVSRSRRHRLALEAATAGADRNPQHEVQQPPNGALDDLGKRWIPGRIGVGGVSGAIATEG